MARSNRGRGSARRQRRGSQPAKIMLRFSKEQVEASKRHLSQSSADAKMGSKPTKIVLRTARKVANPIKRIVLNMWNGSKIAMYPAEKLALRCGNKVFVHTMKAARCVQIA